MRHFQSINFGRSWHVQLWRLPALSALLTASVFAQQPNPAQPQLDPFKLPTTPQATPQPAPSITGDAITSEGAANPFSAGILPAPQGTVTPPAAGNAAAEPAPTAATADLKWRYKRHNGQWWYWLPENRWVIWNNDKWEDYNAATYRVPASAATSGTVIYAQPYNTAVPQTVYRGYNAAPYVGGYSYTPYSRGYPGYYRGGSRISIGVGSEPFYDPGYYGSGYYNPGYNSPGYYNPRYSGYSSGTFGPRYYGSGYYGRGYSGGGVSIGFGF